MIFLDVVQTKLLVVADHFFSCVQVFFQVIAFFEIIMTVSSMQTSFVALLDGDEIWEGDEEIMPLMRRMRVIYRLIKTDRQIDNASREKLLHMQTQQNEWLEELKSINEELLKLQRDRMMRASLEKLERGYIMLGIRRE